MDVKNNEKSSWAPVPRQFATASLAFTGTLQWETPPPKPRTNLSLIPYAAAQAFKDHENGLSNGATLDAGIDAKISLTPSINLDLTFSTKLFFTAFVQYNEQADNVNTNIRLQWRYKPVSDLFIVFSDNHFPAPWNVRNRGLVAKVSYWFN